MHTIHSRGIPPIKPRNVNTDYQRFREALAKARAGRQQQMEFNWSDEHPFALTSPDSPDQD